MRNLRERNRGLKKEVDAIEQVQVNEAECMLRTTELQAARIEGEKAHTLQKAEQ